MTTVAAAAYFLAVCFLQGAEKVRMPMPPSVTPSAEYGCLIRGVVNDHTVSVKDLSKPKMYWITKVSFGKWSGYLPWTRDTEARAHADCVKWRKAIQAEARGRHSGR